MQQRNSWTSVLCSCPQVIYLIGCQEDMSPIILIRIGLSGLTISNMSFFSCCLKLAIKHCQLRQLSAIDHWRQVFVPAITVCAIEIITSDLMRIIWVLLLELRLVHAYVCTCSLKLWLLQYLSFHFLRDSRMPWIGLELQIITLWQLVRYVKQ